MPGFDKEWNDLNPLTSPLLAEDGKIKNRQMSRALERIRLRSFGSVQSNQMEAEPAVLPDSESILETISSETINTSDRLLDSVNIAALPFHRLTSLKHLASAFDSIPGDGDTAYKTISLMNPEKRRRLLHKALKTSGVSDNEASMFDEPLNCFFTGSSNRTPFRAEWRVFSIDSLQRCGEMYLAEMFCIKRRIFEAGENLRVGFEFSGADLLPYLSPESLSPLPAETINRLFLFNLSSSFTLSVSYGNKTGSAGNFASGAIKAKRRVDSWLSKDADEESIERSIEECTEESVKESESETDAQPIDNETVVYRLRLSEYWLEWQRAARLSGFDFSFLETLSSARSVRFYELTKLWRVALSHPVPETGADGRQQPDYAAMPVSPDIKEMKISLQKEMMIPYETFARLMPMQILQTEPEIKRQIDALIEPLRKGAYVESFALESNTRFMETASDIDLKLRFKDQH